MHHVTLHGKEAAAQIRAHITDLQHRCRKAVIPSTAAEYEADIHELYDALLWAESVPLAVD